MCYPGELWSETTRDGYNKILEVALRNLEVKWGTLHWHFYTSENNLQLLRCFSCETIGGQTDIQCGRGREMTWTLHAGMQFFQSN